MNIFLSVIIPAYNEESRIIKTLLDVDRYLSKQKYTYEIIVISDGSKDKTAKIVQSFQNVIKNLKLIDNKENHGKGYVVKQAMLEANGQYRLFMDADNATTINHIEKMWPLVENGYEVIIGSRNSKDAKGAHIKVKPPFIKWILGRLINLLVRLILLDIYDTQCGFKMLSAKAAQDIFSRLTINRWGFDIEVLAIAQKLGYKIGKIPVYWVNPLNNKIHWDRYRASIKELFQIKRNLILKRY